MRYNILIIAIVLLFAGCETKFDDMSQFLQWANEPDNGLVKERTINGYKIRIKYLPAEYLVSQELSYQTTYSQNEIDSLYSYYSNSRTFLLSISHPTESAAEPDMLISSSNDYADYAGKYLALSFGLQSYIYINGDEKTYPPVLATMEQTTSVNAGRNFFIVFADVDETDELFNEDILDIVFDDEIFNTGISHYRFTKKDIDNLPDFRFLKITKEL